MNLSDATQAVVLLTSQFGSHESGPQKPLTPAEWKIFAGWLHSKGKQPADLLDPACDEFLAEFCDRAITGERLRGLLDRGTSLALAIERWQSASVWVISRSDEEYPKRLKRRLGWSSPPLLYGCGPIKLLSKGGVAVVGSRAASDESLRYSSKLGSLAASAGYSIVSGGAKGVDQAAMMGALTAEGTVVGVLADSLIRAATSNKYRTHLRSGNLTLVTSFHPEAKFKGYNAMQRNKYIYCLADTSVVVHSAWGKGGTWAGAMENIKKKWVPTWVMHTEDSAAGNEYLTTQGGIELTANSDQIDIESLFLSPSVNAEEKNTKRNTDNTEKTGCLPESTVASDPMVGSEKLPAVAEATLDEPHVAPDEGQNLNLSLYEIFVDKMKEYTAERAVTSDELVQEFDLQKSQVNAWLKKAVEEKKVVKIKNPVRYEVAKVKQGDFLV